MKHPRALQEPSVTMHVAAVLGQVGVVEGATKAMAELFEKLASHPAPLSKKTTCFYLQPDEDGGANVDEHPRARRPA